MIDRREREVRPTHSPSLAPQAFECLGRGDFVYQVEIHVQQGGPAVFLMDDVRTPHLLEKRPRIHGQYRAPSTA